MPIIKVWCLPTQTEEKLNRLYETIVFATLSVSELNLGKNDITCLFPPDMMTYGLGHEIIVEICGLFEKPERTEEVRQRLAKNVGSMVKGLYPDAKVECSVSSFNPVSQGFWVSEKSVAKNDKLDCPTCGSIEHMQSITGKCPGCGRRLGEK